MTGSKPSDSISSREPGIQGNMVVGINSGWEEMKGCEDQGEATLAVSDRVGGASGPPGAPDGGWC